MSELPNIADFLGIKIENQPTDKTIKSVLMNFARNFDNQELNEDTIEQFFRYNYGFPENGEISEQTCKLMNNFIRLVADVFNELKVIDENIEKSINAIKNKDKDSYEVKKHTYFIKLNKEAKITKENYIFNELLVKLKSRMKFQRNGMEKIELLEKLDVFSWNREWYNPEYEFGVLVKFFDAFNSPKSKIEELILLKKTDVEGYYEYVKKYISDNKVSEYILFSVKNHYLLQSKKEVFEILSALFDNSAFQTFVSLGAIQVEGLFYDLCSAIRGGDRSLEEGTIVNKLDKVFEGYEIQKLIYYPYFAFEVPIYRNEVAHNGIMNDVQIEHRAYDILLDMYSIIKLMKRDALPFNNVFFLVFQIKEYSQAKDYSEENYFHILSALISSQDMGIIGEGQFSIYSIIKNIERYEAILRTYRIYNEDKSYLDLYEEGLELRQTFYDDNFWQYLLNLLKEHNGETLVKLLKKISNEFINTLPKTSQAKQNCIEIKKVIG